MPIPQPSLDDRTFQHLLEEARGLVPQYSPEWTDHNQTDMGVTLVQFLSWVAEKATYSLKVPAGEDMQQFLGFLVSLGAFPPAPILRRLRAMRIGQWSPAKEAQVGAFLVSRICRMHYAAATTRHGCKLEALERDLAAFLYLQHRLAEVIAETERKANSPTPGANWKYLIVAVHWLLFQCDWCRLPTRQG